MRPLPLAHLPIKVATILPVITNCVAKAAHGEPPRQVARLDRAISHTKLLLAELQSARTILKRERDAA